MAYCVLADLINAFPEQQLIQLTDDARTGSVNTTVTDAAIEAAASEINGYIQVIVDLPLSSTPALIKSLNVDLAICRLLRRQNTEIPSNWENSETMARQTLAEIRDGKQRVEMGQSSESPRVMIVDVRDEIFSETELDKF